MLRYQNILGLILLSTALLVLAACGSEDIESELNQIENPGLEGTWASCRNDGAFTTDYKFVDTFSGGTVTEINYDYTSADGSCSTGEILQGTLTFDYSIGGGLASDLGGNSVYAKELDVYIPPPIDISIYTIFYIKAAASPHELYFGDNTIPPNDGLTPTTRPTTLQTQPSYRQ